jgi:5,6,7,8-tetrahydromethanopterin hydro-lyase
VSDEVPRSQFGEAFVGEGVNAAHVNTVLGGKGGPVEVAWVTALATPRAGYVAFVASLAPNVAVQPMTLFVNKAPIEGERHAGLTWGAAHAGVAAGVMDAVGEEIILSAFATTRLLIAAVWVNPHADDEAAVFANNRRATKEALAVGRDGKPTVAEAMAAAANPHNAFYAGPGEASTPST